MDKEKEVQLRSRGNFMSRSRFNIVIIVWMWPSFWPDARGIYHNEAMDFFVWLNEEDHLRIISIFLRFATACNEIQKVLKSEGYDFMHNDRLGNDVARHIAQMELK